MRGEGERKGRRGLNEWCGMLLVCVQVASAFLSRVEGMKGKLMVAVQCTEWMLH